VVLIASLPLLREPIYAKRRHRRGVLFVDGAAKLPRYIAFVELGTSEGRYKRGIRREDKRVLSGSGADAVGFHQKCVMRVKQAGVR
jgi:hypothetical protein